jgi:glycosyltransferase involved in cell wall biosynthesis
MNLILGKTNTKKIYLEPLWKPHSLYNSMINNPPGGYQFVLPADSATRVYKSLGKKNLSYSLLYQFGRVAPLNLVHSYVRKYRRPSVIPALTYASNHLIFRDEPWVVDLEYLSLALGSGKYVQRYKKLLERSFQSPNCKKILCWYEACKKTLDASLDCSQFENKITVFLPYGQQRDFSKQYNNKKIKLLFTGSANILGEFVIKGGFETVEAFIALNQTYNFLELVIRSDVPREVKTRLAGLDNVRIIDHIIPWAELEHEFQTADIFILPAHNTPWLALLDAMSYELPVVTIDVWANSEIVADGKTGLLAPKSRDLEYFDENFTPQWDRPQFLRAIKKPDSDVVRGLVEKLSLLIDDPQLRRAMGRAARWEVEQGRFSIRIRNEKLKQIFEEAAV